MTSYALAVMTHADRVHLVLDVVCEHYSVAVADVLSPSRYAHHVRPRHVAMAISHELLRYSSHELVGYFARGDHATVIHARHAIADLLSIDPAFRREYRHMLRRCRTGLGLVPKKKRPSSS